MKTAQNPLTGTPKPDLDWSRDRTPASTEFDDIYFSVDGGLEETENVFLKGNDLPNRWLDRKSFCIGELGFGTGLNFLACWALWQETASADAHLHFISIEAYPWSATDLQQALQHFPQLANYSKQLIDQWPGQVKGMHRLHFGNINLTLIHMDVDRALSQYQGPGIDAWFLDGFSPAKNPDMWSPSVMAALARLSTDGATIGTFTVAGHVRRALQDAGFDVERKPGFGRKRHRLEARFSAPDKKPPLLISNSPPIIIGSGIAGASVARAFHQRGVSSILIDPAPDLSNAASGNPAALVMPRLDLQDRPESRFFLNAFQYAVRVYARQGQVLQTGAVQIAKSSDEQKRFEKIANQSALPLVDMHLVTPETAQKYLDMPLAATFCGLKFSRAQTIDPVATIKAFTVSCDFRNARITRIVKDEDVWVVYNEAQEIARSDKIFVAPGADIKIISGLDDLPVRFTRGQICWGNSQFAPAHPVTFGGYALKHGDCLMLGATHDHVDAGQNSDLRAEDDEKNIQTFAGFTGQETKFEILGSRAGVRVTTKDTLPISTQIKPGLFVMTGLGSRGFMMAPLLGEALVSEAMGEPLPVTKDTKMRFGTREKI